MKRNGTERKYDVNGLDRCLVSFVPASFIGSSGGGIAQVVHRSAVEQVVTLTAGVTVKTSKRRFIKNAKNLETIAVKKCNCQSIEKYPDFKDSFIMYLHFTRIL